MNLLYPDYYFDDIYSATADFFVQKGIKGILFDIDNTLAPYEMELPDQKITNYIHSLMNCGIKVAFISNNNRERVEKFNIFGCFSVHKAAKPSVSALLKAMENMQTDKYTTALCGDQIFTDIFAGKQLGLMCVLVKPINDKKTLFFRFKRLMEKPVIRGFLKKRGNSY